MDPYLRPVYDALYQILGKEGRNDDLWNVKLLGCPLAYMRSRTLEDTLLYIMMKHKIQPSYKWKMFLTLKYLGFIKMIVNGDESDWLATSFRVKSAGLIDAME